ncbi:hypothetical protein [Paraburkholderia sediminicola]|uniref:hypothetical protein n=1 Tax=Paraburkholderia sediminicola TaxID=458836 RepID=UPI0038BA0379
MTRQTIADYLTNALAAAGVERIWGVTSDSLNGLSDSLRRFGKIEWAHAKGFSLYMLRAVLNAKGNEVVELATTWLR